MSTSVDGRLDLEGREVFMLKEQAYPHEPFAKYLAEFVGTFFLVFTVGCNVHTGSIGAAISIGGILMVMVYALGPVSGGHLNPAVTVAVGLSGRDKISFEHMCCYIMAQIAGGLFGAFHYWIIFNDAFLLRPVAGYSHHDAACAEILYTMALCYVVLNVATTENKEQGNVPLGEKNNFFGLAIGLTVTSAAIAVGPISGCSLNPAVSIGALFASKLAHGVVEMRVVGLYVFSPFLGSALAALFFFFVQGGLTGQYEYEKGPSRPASRVTTPARTPVPSRPNSPAPRYISPLPAPTTKKFLQRGEIYYIPEAVEHHTIFMGLSWTIQELGAKTGTKTEGPGHVDCDASCIKFDKTGRLIAAIYFEQPRGKEDRHNDKSIIVHHGDSLTGKGEGFGFSSPPTSSQKLKKSGQSKGQEETKDDERIEIRHLYQLQQKQPRCTYIFFVVNIFSSQAKFELLQDLKIRIVDQDDSNRELVRFETKDMKNNKANAFVLGVLFLRNERWIFQVVDEGYNVKDFATFREFEPYCQKIVRKMEGLDK